MSGWESTAAGRLLLVVLTPFLMAWFMFASFVLYLGRPLIMKYGVATNAYYVSSGVASGRRAGSYSHWAVMRYGDIAGGTTDFDYSVGVPRLHVLETRTVTVGIHYIPGWPSTVVVDEDFEPIAYSIAWITTFVMLGIVGVRFYRWRRGPAS